MGEKKLRSEKRACSRKAARARKRALRRRQLRIVLALLLLIALLLFLCGWQFAEYKNFQMKRAAVEVQTFYEGTTVEGMDVSHLTLSQALSHWEQNVEPAFSQRSATLSDGTVVTAEMVGYSSDYQSVLTAAYEAGRSGNIDQRYESVSYVGGGIDYEVTRVPYTKEGIAAFVADYAAQIDCVPVDSKLLGYDDETHSLEFVDGQTGQTVNQEALCEDIEAALAAGGGQQVQVEIAYTPYVSTQSEYGVIATYTTDASSSSSDRLYNISLALESIDGLCLWPGQEFSFNEVVGQRTKERGYRKATAYSGGRSVLEYGGGICQVSSTLYAAVRQTDFEVIERYAHSRSVSYIPSGWDATVDWGNKDLRFVNSRDVPVYISCYLDGAKQVHVSLLGKLEMGDHDMPGIV